jgi:hypothetical protein
LHLSEQQTTELRKVRYDLQTVATELAAERKAAQISPQEFDRGVGRALQNAADQALLVLDDRQREQVSAWIGKPVPFTRQTLRLAIRGNHEPVRPPSAASGSR